MQKRDERIKPHHIKMWRLESAILGHCALFDEDTACRNLDWVNRCEYATEAHRAKDYTELNHCYHAFLKRYVLKGGEMT